MKEYGALVTAEFVAAGHKASSDGVKLGLKRAVDEFASLYVEHKMQVAEAQATGSAVSGALPLSLPAMGKIVG